MIKYRVECCNGSKYFNENEKDKADKYFKTRLVLGLPAEMWCMQISAFAQTQVLLQKSV